jgi:hypothetical protein
MQGMLENKIGKAMNEIQIFNQWNQFELELDSENINEPNTFSVLTGKN